MYNFNYYTPTKVVFGKNTEDKCGELVKEQGCKKVMIHYGSGSVKRTGLLDKVKASLDEAKINYIELGGAVPNPRLSLVYEGIELAKKEGVDFILAVGGGSAIDSAKAIGYGVANEGDVWDFYDKKRQATGCLPIGVVLTIAATGSEMSNSAVLTDEETQDKSGIGSDLIRPKFAIMNPKLTYTLPKYQLTCGIVDIFMHTIERYFTPVHGNELTDEIAEGLMRTLIRNAAKAYENQEDYDAMSEIMWAGSLSHNGLTGLGRAKDFSVHKLGHALGAKYDKAHGATLSAVWGSWAEYVYKNDEERFAHYAKKVWGVEEEDVAKAAKEGIRRTVEYFREIHMPTNLKELEIGEVSEEDLRELAMAATLNDTVKLSKIKELTAEDVYQIFRKAAGK